MTLYICKTIQHYRSFSSDVTAAILVCQNNEMAAIFVYGTGISSFLFKYFVLFHHPTGATDHVSENDLYYTILHYRRLLYKTIKQDYTTLYKTIRHYKTLYVISMFSFVVELIVRYPVPVSRALISSLHILISFSS